MKKSSNLPQKQCPLTLDEAMEYEMKHGSLFNNPNIDIKKIRRTVSNRLSAQRSRIKMSIYTRDMEKMVKDLEALISILIPQVGSCKEINKLLQLENDSLQQERKKRSNESTRLELAIEEKRAEIQVFKEREKTAHKNRLPSDSRGKQTYDFRFEPLKHTPYPNINLYQICLQNQWKDPKPSRFTEIKPAKEAEETIQEYKDVDQYTNFDALSAADGEDLSQFLASGLWDFFYAFSCSCCN